LEPVLLLERPQLVARVVERASPELRHGAVVRDGPQRRADERPQLLDLLARLIDVGPAVDRGGAVLDLLVEFRDGFLELIGLAGKLLNRRDRIGADGPRSLL